MKSKGGEGVFREFVERILEENGMMEETLKKIIQNIKENRELL